MPRRKKVLKRPNIAPDQTFQSVLVSRLINRIMWDGKKTVATKIVNTALNEASKELEMSPVEVLELAVNNVRPQVEVKSMRVGGANLQVPVEPYPARALRLALTWIVDAARNIKGKPMSKKLALVLTQSARSEGPAFMKREEVHRMANSNKAFAHHALRMRKSF